MTVLHSVHTADLSPSDRSRIRDLLDDAFGGRFDDHDWEHALGGLHILISVDGTLIAHGSVVRRQFLHQGRSVRCGYVEAVAVHPAHRRRGFGSAVMTEAERLIDHGYALGGLSASASAVDLYRGRGWRRWPGGTAVLGPAGVTPTPGDDDSTLLRLVPGGTPLSVTDPVVCDWRDGDVW
ncbi:aminoglycoside 2'-N-acetyltransferase [Actinoplanes sp. SE50]|uniref:GNAT family N-acetyltransferase n=1 Tax=unclassified Actinoplanes TaxID=2626549 RepID=UPI00023EBF9B|nr:MULTISPECIES: GNAT family N-acetyltransferase [unclassified Actinoplanes]AEV86921.1 Aminoglycoside 2'-N-acetyltransferase [Actinoplanes sp. SE50/110]ATO85317.1 aminoglycoside 2'-N-acetyltransferase [Actinoplanes sp. SE50]SLM02728.1 aminoglycoside 2'-N-acetyltransferase [Actinoplanes sp. SE50/110]